METVDLRPVRALGGKSMPEGRRRQARLRVCARLQARRLEIEQGILARVHAISDPVEVGDPSYATGLRTAVSAAFDYALAGLEGEEAQTAQIPPALYAQVRRAVRAGINLDTVLRRYFAGYTLLEDCVRRELGASGLGDEGLGRRQAILFDQLVTAISDEYRREAASSADTNGLTRTERQRAADAKRLLAGELVDAGALEYPLDAWHSGAIAVGPGGTEAIRALATALDRRLLLVHSGEGAVWAWLGGEPPIASDEIVRIAPSCLPPEVALAVGEPVQGLAGWRLTHRQALAALPLAMQSMEITRYADVALLTAALRDEVLAGTLRALYLEPLARGRDDGEALRQTLLAYFAAGRHVSSAAAALGVSRQTVNSRLRLVESLIGRSLDTCAAEVETALRLDASSRQAP